MSVAPLPDLLPPPPPPPALRLAEPPPEDLPPALRPATTAELPDPATWGRQLMQAIAEVASGDRPPRQLARYLSEQVHDELAAAGALARAARLGRRPLPRAVLVSLHVCEPADGVLELAATLRRGQRAQAIAARLEGFDGRWVATAVESR